MCQINYIFAFHCRLHLLHIMDTSHSIVTITSFVEVSEE